MTRNYIAHTGYNRVVLGAGKKESECGVLAAGGTGELVRGC